MDEAMFVPRQYCCNDNANNNSDNSSNISTNDAGTTNDAQQTGDDRQQTTAPPPYHNRQEKDRKQGASIMTKQHQVRATSLQHHHITNNPTCKTGNDNNAMSPHHAHDPVPTSSLASHCSRGGLWVLAANNDEQNTTMNAGYASANGRRNTNTNGQRQCQRHSP
jgi:hypothetical protein